MVNMMSKRFLGKSKLYLMKMKKLRKLPKKWRKNFITKSKEKTSWCTFSMFFNSKITQFMSYFKLIFSQLKQIDLVQNHRSFILTWKKNEKNALRNLDLQMNHLSANQKKKYKERSNREWKFLSFHKLLTNQ